jgi:hypothetical protein
METPEPVNSASRLHSILVRMDAIADSAPALTLWRTLLEISDDDDARCASTVARRLDWILQELDAIRVAMAERASQFPETLYQSTVTRARSACSVLLLTSTAQHVKQYVRPEDLKTMAFLTHVLPSDETRIEVSELLQLHDQVEVLAEQVRVSQLPDGLKAIVSHHLGLIRDALDQYPIRGAKALRQAMHAAVGELVEVKAAVHAHHGAPELSALRRLWTRIHELSDIALHAQKIAQLGRAVWEEGNVLLLTYLG